jgi:heat shock protein HslJ
MKRLTMVAAANPKRMTIAMGELMSTKMAGPPSLMELETSFSKTMSSVDGFHVSGNDLELLSMGAVVAKFRAAE